MIFFYEGFNTKQRFLRVCYNSIGEPRSWNIAYCKSSVTHNSDAFYLFLTYLNWYFPNICIWLPDICTFHDMDRHRTSLYLQVTHNWFRGYTYPARVLENCWNDSLCCSWHYVWNTYAAVFPTTCVVTALVSLVAQNTAHYEQCDA